VKKIFCLFVAMMLFCASPAVAKIIFVGSQGGVKSYAGVSFEGEFIDPLEGITKDTWEEIIKDIAIGNNGNKNSNSVDASIAFVRIKCDHEIKARVYSDTANVTDAFDWIRENYEDGDYIFLVGYSAGGKFVLNLATLLDFHYGPVHYLGLIDPILWVNNILIQDNVKVVDVFIQQTDGFWGSANFFQGNWFFLYDKDRTEYHNYTVTGSGINHLSIDNEEIVWRNLGGHMVYLLDIDPREIEEEHEQPSVEDYGDSESDETAPEETARDINDFTDDESYQDNSSISDTDVHIDKVTVGIRDGGSVNHKDFTHEVIVYTGQGVDIEADIENKGDEDITVKIRYLWDDDKDFGFDSNNYLGRDEDVEIDHGKRNNGQYENVLKHFRDVRFDNPGTYYLYVETKTNDDMDEDQSVFHNIREYGKVTVLERSIVAYFTATPKESIGPAMVYFLDTSQGTINNWSWNFGDGATSTEINPSHYYSDFGSYKVTMTVSDSNFKTSISRIIIIKEPPKPSIRITNPTRSDKWRSSKDHTIRWTWANFSKNEAIKIEYTCDGKKHWRTIYRGYTNNDGSKKWKMDKSKTKDTSHGYIRILRRSDNSVLGISPRFKIDHARGDPKW